MNSNDMHTSRLPQILMALLLFAVSLSSGLFIMEKLLQPQSADKRLLQISHKANRLYCSVASDSEFCGTSSQSQYSTGAPVPPSPAIVIEKNHPVFGNMHWSGGSEAEAAAFMARAKTLAMLHMEDNNKYLRKDMKELLAPLWRDYPVIVSASACLYCGDITDTVLDFIQEYELSPEWVERVGKGISRYLPHLANSGALSGDELYRLARIQAQLGSAGDSRVAKAIAEPLVRNNDMEHLALWVV